MNLSCSGGGLPESGCLFFKVGGPTCVTNGKNKLYSSINNDADFLCSKI